MNSKDINEIMAVLPHRYPMLLVDRILDIEPGKRVRGLKNVTINEQFFTGHYPGMPIMPGVLIIEAMAQTGAVMLLAEEGLQGTFPVIGAIDKVKYKKPVVPGDALITEVELLWFKSGIGKIKGTATVDGELAAEMEMVFKLVQNGS